MLIGTVEHLSDKFDNDKIVLSLEKATKSTITFDLFSLTDIQKLRKFIAEDCMKIRNNEFILDAYLTYGDILLKSLGLDFICYRAKATNKNLANFINSFEIFKPVFCCETDIWHKFEKLKDNYHSKEYDEDEMLCQFNVFVVDLLQLLNFDYYL